MSKFMDTAKQVEPIVAMLDEGGCRYASAVIFEDGSGSIIVEYRDAELAKRLLTAHGVRLHGYRSAQNMTDFKFGIDREELRRYIETPCPYCGRDVAHKASADG